MPQTQTSDPIVTDQKNQPAVNPTGARIEFSLTELDFGDSTVGSYVHRSVAISNTGGQSFAGLDSSIQFSGSFSYVGGKFPGFGGNCGAVLAPGETCTIAISSQASETGPVSGAISIASAGQAATTLPLKTLVKPGIDQSFGAYGIATVSGSGSSHHLSHLSLNGNKLNLMGYYGTHGDRLYARMNLDGSLDPTFNGTGFRVHSTGTDIDKTYEGALLSDGRFVGFGYRWQSRFHGSISVIGTDGVPDPAFGVSGSVWPDAAVNRDDKVWAGTVQSDDKIIAVGYVNNPDSNFAIWRYTETGTADPGFGTAGVAYYDNAGATDEGYFAITDAQSGQEKILTGGKTSGDWLVMRYLPDGTLDPAFGAGGVLLPGMQGGKAERALITADSKYMLAGSTSPADPGYSVATAAKLNIDGSFDTSFGSGGIFTVSLPDPSSFDLVISSPDQTAYYFVGANTVGGTSQCLVVKTNLSGVIDTTFFDQGIYRFALEGKDVQCRGAAFGPDGKLYLGASGHQSAVGSRFWVVRLHL